MQKNKIDERNLIVNFVQIPAQSYLEILLQIFVYIDQQINVF